MRIHRRLFKPLFRTETDSYNGRRVTIRLVAELLLLVVLAVSLSLVSSSSATTAAQSTVEQHTQTAIPAKAAAPTQAQGVPASQNTSLGTTDLTPAATAQGCQKAAMPIVSPLAISTASPGLAQEIALPFYYQVHGNTPNQVEAQVMQCSPVIEGGQDFTASTIYSINWLYTYTSDPTTELCSLSNIAVGVRVEYVFPEWSSTGASGTFTKEWSTFIANLTTHEHGHAQLDISYAGQILSALQALPPSTCNMVQTTATTTAQNIIRNLDSANAAYDTATNHGLTQGALFPN